MKRNTNFILLLALLTVTVQASFDKSFVEVSDQLTAMFSFDDGLCKDEILGNTGVKPNTLSVPDRFGTPNKALHFNGYSFCQISGLNSKFNMDAPRDLTITTWAYFNAFGGIIFDNKAQIDWNEDGYHLQVQDDGKLVFLAHDDSNSEIGWGSSQNRSRVICSTKIIPKNQWVFISIAKSRKEVKFYVDNNLECTQNLPKENIIYSDGTMRYFGFAEDNDFYQGSHGFTSKQSVNYYLDDFRIYQKALSITDIQKIKNYQPPQSCSEAYPGSTQCKSCKGDRTLQLGHCICPIGKWDNNNLNCDSCAIQCSSCSSTNVCTACIDSTNRDLSKNCDCKDGTYEDAFGNCQPCDKKCSKCSGQPDNCDECSDSTTRNAIPGCLCKIGYFEEGNVLCGSCSYKCNICLTTPGNCQSCSDPSRENDGTCDCKNGFFNVVNQKICTACSSDLCETCSDGSGCTSCKDTLTRNNDSTCSCKDGYYQVGVEASCTPCLSSCQQCSNGSSCTQCKPNRDSGNNCQCLDGFYEDSNNDCQSCNMTICSTCSGNASSCNLCSHTTRDKDDSCNCRIGYIDTGSSVCENCDYQCSSCTGSKTSCTGCSDINRINDGTCICKPGFYDNGTTTCQECDHQCSSCQDRADKCTGCSDINRINDEFCNCKPGWFENTITKNCEECDPKCSICSGSSDNCGACEDATNRISDGTCACKPGLWDDGDETCEQCLYMCETCQNGTNCDTCKTTSPQRIGLNCDCPTGYFDNNVLECVQCNYKCSKCENGTNCQECAISSPQRIKSENCRCPDGYYDDGSNGACQQCIFGCSKCSDGVSCDECRISDPIRNLTDKCKCPQGYFDDLSSDSCQRCPRGCSQCTGLSSCDQCTISSPPRIQSEKCKCPDDYYDNGTDDQCQPCGAGTCGNCAFNGCQSCTTETTCDICKISTNPPRLGIENQCSCPPGYYELTDDPQCYKCAQGCKSCSDGNTCDECLESPSFPRILGTKCSCPQGTYHKEGINECQKCLEGCESCSNGESCDSCLDITKEIGKNCKCYDSEFEDTDGSCQPCSSNCKKCLNRITCTECPESSPSRLSGSCDCPPGYFDDGNNDQCQKCIHGCNECLDTSRCLPGKCKDSLSPRSGPQCECGEEGYFDDGINDQCQKCSHKCGNCLGQADNCQSCSHSSRDSNCECTGDFWEMGVPECQEGCPKGKYHIGNQICEDCSSNCETCDNSPDECLSCSVGMYRENNPPLCSCMKGYYSDTDSTNCLPCKDECLECEKSNGCTKCKSASMRLPLCLISKEFRSFFEQMVSGDQIEVKKCHAKCQSCKQKSDICEVCSVGFKRNQTPPSCACETGYYNDPDKVDCQQCPKNCISCVSQWKCTECALNLVLNQYSNICECGQGFKFSSIKQECIPCLYYEGECYEYCPKDTISNLEYGSCIKVDKSLIEQKYQYIVYGLILSVIIMLAKLGLGYASKAKFYELKEQYLPQKEAISHLNNKQKDQEFVVEDLTNLNDYDSSIVQINQPKILQFESEMIDQNDYSTSKQENIQL